ncbi:hypothetical protein K438DRAFT_1767124 [Mycena galopus ATCC 62051]|nr:hypothetical protein K438DRAFT_1767124 [Mycena galopus ATCC 62051]
MKLNASEIHAEFATNLSTILARSKLKREKRVLEGSIFSETRRATRLNSPAQDSAYVWLMVAFRWDTQNVSGSKAGFDSVTRMGQLPGNPFSRSALLTIAIMILNKVLKYQLHKLMAVVQKLPFHHGGVKLGKMGVADGPPSLSISRRFLGWQNSREMRATTTGISRLTTSSKVGSRTKSHWFSEGPKPGMKAGVVDGSQLPEVWIFSSLWKNSEDRRQLEFDVGCLIKKDRVVEVLSGRTANSRKPITKTQRGILPSLSPTATGPQGLTAIVQNFLD